ncbi:MAG: mechanosensitive ion channel family protein [Planctomycetota bacterium]|jgi:small conductance mechanosensitive channel
MRLYGLLAGAAPAVEGGAGDNGGLSLDLESIWATVQQMVAAHSLKVLAGLAILLIGWLLAKLIRAITEKILLRSKVEPTVVSFVKHLTYYTLMAFVLIAALNQFGVQTASIIAVMGAAGLAVGLALQGALSNFAAGILLIIFRPFRVGDYVSGGGVEGTVTEIGILSCELDSLDNRKLVVPNAKMMGDSIVNFTANGTRRVDLVVGVAYGADLARAREVILDVMRSDERVLKSPEPSVGVLELADSSVNLAVRPWTAVAGYWDVYFGMLEAVKNRLDAEGISIPFPQRDVHLYQKA